MVHETARDSNSLACHLHSHFSLLLSSVMLLPGHLEKRIELSKLLKKENQLTLRASFSHINHIYGKKKKGGGRVCTGMLIPHS